MKNARTSLLLFAGIALTSIAAQPSSVQKLVVTGDVEKPLELTLNDLMRMPRATVRTPGNPGAEYEGVWLRDILVRAGAPMGQNLRGKALASYVLAKASDGYQVLFTLAEVEPQLGGERLLVADKKDGQSLPKDQAPLRIVCPDDKEGARSVRMLESLEVVRLRK